MTQEISAFIKQHEQTIAPLYKDYSLKFWELSTDSNETREKALVQSKSAYLKVYNNRQDFRQLRSWLPKLADLPEIEARQLRLIHDAYVPNQIEEAVLQEIVERETQIENEFNTFRAPFENAQASDNQLRDVLKSETKIGRRRTAWEASKEVGHAIAPKLLELIKLRNREARKLGYSDYYTMMLELQELNVTWVFSLFDRLEQLSFRAFSETKVELDAR